MNMINPGERFLVGAYAKVKSPEASGSPAATYREITVYKLPVSVTVVGC